MHLATWNVNSIKARVDHLKQWVAEAQPDVLCLQELKAADIQVPVGDFEAMGFVHHAILGQKTYNGVAILSRLPLSDVVMGFTLGERDPQSRLVRATVGGVRVFCCYVPNGSTVGSDKFTYKLQWLDRLRAELLAEGVSNREVAVCGDLNVALDDLSVWDPFGMDGEVLYHPLEREKIAAILATGLADTYRAKKPEGAEYTWWDYRMLGFQKNHGLRIDHIFLTPGLLARTQEIAFWRPVRKWDKPSDHIPISVRLLDTGP
jgi:exodeoxyribonuclease III